MSVRVWQWSSVCVCVGGRLRDSHGAGLGEDVGVDVHHQVPPGGVLHDEAHVLLGLEARKQVDQEGVAHAVHRLEDTLLTHQAGGRETSHTQTWCYTLYVR